MAGWALGLAFVGCLGVSLVLSVVLAIIVLVESQRDAQDRGRGMAIGALVVDGLWLVGLAISIAAGLAASPSPTTGRGDPVEVRTDGDLPRETPSKLRVGDCLNDENLTRLAAGDGSVQAGFVTVVPCERLHEFETFQTVRIPGADFPGRDEIRRQAFTGCGKAFKPFVGRAYGPSDLDFWVYYPTADSWTTLSDHAITCVIGQPGTKTAGSLRGSRR